MLFPSPAVKAPLQPQPSTGTAGHRAPFPSLSDCRETSRLLIERGFTAEENKTCTRAPKSSQLIIGTHKTPGNCSSARLLGKHQRSGRTENFRVPNSSKPLHAQVCQLRKAVPRHAEQWTSVLLCWEIEPEGCVLIFPRGNSDCCLYFLTEDRKLVLRATAMGRYQSTGTYKLAYKLQPGPSPAAPTQHSWLGTPAPVPLLGNAPVCVETSGRKLMPRVC